MNIPTTAQKTSDLIREANKAVKSLKPGEQMIYVEIGYSIKLILPYKDGINLASCFENAQILEQNYNKPERVRQFDSDEIRVSPMSAQQYQDYLMAGLLGVPAAEIKAARINGETQEAQKRAEAFRNQPSY